MTPRTKLLHELDYPPKIIESWAAAEKRGTTPLIPSPQQVLETQDTRKLKSLYFYHDRLLWRSDIRIIPYRLWDGTDAVKLVIRLPNDGFFYKEEVLQPVVSSGCLNPHHNTDCLTGWEKMTVTEVWPKLLPFETWVRQWLQCPATQEILPDVWYHAEDKRMDIVMHCKDTCLTVEFNFEPGYFAVEESYMFHD